MNRLTFASNAELEVRVIGDCCTAAVGTGNDHFVRSIKHDRVV